MIRDHIVCGINDDRTQRRLLSESTLDFKKAMEIAQGMEVAARNIIDLHAQNPSGHTGSVNKFYNPNKKKHFKRPSDNSGQCFRCGENHDPSTCKYINAKCYSCSARGHISPMCRDKNSQQRVSQHNIIRLSVCRNNHKSASVASTKFAFVAGYSSETTQLCA